MQIREIFETRVEEKIEPVIKVGERQDERKLASEIGSYVVTPTIEPQGELFNAQFLVRTILDDLETREKSLGKPCRFVLVLDEAGQWIEDDAGRLNLLQAFVEEAAEKGQGKVWIFVNDNPGVLRDLGELKNTNQRLPECTQERFTTFYAFLSYQIHLIPEIVKSLQSSGGRTEQLSGSTRTLLGIVQDVLSGKGRRSYLNSSVGEIVSFDEIYFNLANNEVNPDHKDEIKAITQVVPNASLLTQRVVEVLYLIGELKYIPKTIDNLARLLVEHTTDDLSSIINRIRPELDKLSKATIVAKIGDNYEFLTGERRTFEEEVAEESAGIRWQDLENGLSKFATTDVLVFTNIPFKGAELPARISFDEISASKDGFIDIRVYSPLAALSTKVPDLENQSLEAKDQKTIFVLCDRIPGFDDQLRYYLAMQTVIDRWKGDSHKSIEVHKLASERESNDLKKLGGNVRAGIRDGLKHAHVIFRGSTHTVSPKAGQTPGEALRAELATFWPTLYPKYEKVPVRITSNERQAILDVLTGAKNLSANVHELKIFDKAGQVDQQCPLLDAIRIFLSTRQSKKERILGQDLLNEFIQPPYGWDGNAVRVGMAALVRSGALRVLINKKPYTNPIDSELQDALRDSRQFNKVELVLEETEPDLDVLTEVRKLLIKLTGNRKIDETPAALAEEMEFGQEILDKAARATLWAGAASLPLPAEFQNGKEVFEKILALSNTMHRVNEIYLHQENLNTYVDAIRRVSEFVDKWGKAFTEMRDFAGSVGAAEYRLPSLSACASFLSNWKTAQGDATITDGAVWKDLQNAQAAAQLDLAKILNDWRQEARTLATEALDRLPQDLADNNLPADELQESLGSGLKQFLATLDSATGVAHLAALPEQARRLIRALEVAIRQERAERDSQLTSENKQPGSYQTNPSVKHISVTTVAKKTRVRTVEEWNQIRDQLDEAVRWELADGNEVELG